MKHPSRRRCVASLAILALVALGTALVAPTGCAGSGGSTGSIQLPMGSGTWDLWWCPDCSKVKATQDGPPSESAQPLGTVVTAPAGTT